MYGCVYHQHVAAHVAALWGNLRKVTKRAHFGMQPCFFPAAGDLPDRSLSIRCVHEKFAALPLFFGEGFSPKDI